MALLLHTGPLSSFPRTTREPRVRRQHCSPNRVWRGMAAEVGDQIVECSARVIGRGLVVALDRDQDLGRVVVGGARCAVIGLSSITRCLRLELAAAGQGLPPRRPLLADRAPASGRWTAAVAAAPCPGGWRAWVG